VQNAAIADEVIGTGAADEQLPAGSDEQPRADYLTPRKLEFIFGTIPIIILIIIVFFAVFV